MDQLLGREPGRIFNNEALAVAAGTQSPEGATQVIEHSWSKFGFTRHPYLQTAVELQVFDFLDQSPLSLEEISSRTASLIFELDLPAGTYRPRTGIDSG
jgi:hypothetical protein